MFQFEQLVKFAKDTLPPALFLRFLENRVTDHTPEWHELGVISHLKAVWDITVELENQTGIKVADIGLLHDIGKIRQFRKAVMSLDLNGNTDGAYYGHENLSAQIAKGLRVSEIGQIAIANHQFAYLPINPRNLATRLQTKDVFFVWLLLSAADSVGKGWPPDSISDRLQFIPQRFYETAAEFGIHYTDPLLDLAISLVTTAPLPKITIPVLLST